MKNLNHYVKGALITILFLFIFILILMSCQHDQSDWLLTPQKKTYERLKLKGEPVALDLFNYVKNMESFKKSSDSLNLPEDVLKTLANNGKTSYSFSIKVSNDSPFFRNLVITKTISGWVGYYLDFYPDFSWLYTTDSLPSMNRFTGMTLKYDLYFNLLYTSYFKQGKIYKYVLNQNKSEAFCMQVTDAYFMIDGIGRVESCDPYTSSTTGWTYSDCQMVFIGYEIPCPETTGGGSYSQPTWPDGSSDSGTNIPGSGTTGGTTGGPTGGGAGGTTIGINNPTLPIIDATSIMANPKTNCIYTRLTQTNMMSRYVKNFDGEFPVSHLKYELNSSLPNNLIGTTSPMNNYWITIKINENLVSQLPVLELAATFIHETIHAEIDRILASVSNIVYPQDWPGLFDYYSRYKKGPETWQHQLMADFYVDIVANALKEFDNNQNPFQLYKDLAWEGLQGTVAFNNLDQNERNRITSSVINFRTTGQKTCVNSSTLIE